MNKLFFIFLLNFIILLYSCRNNSCIKENADTINREALVHRHIPGLTEVDTLSPFTVGNGEFAYTADITGLQTFAEFYEKGIPLGTQSQWGWHTVSNPNNYTLDQTFEYYDTYGRQVSYASKQHSKAGQWLRANPHRLHLGEIGFNIIKSDSSEIQLADVKNINQSLNLWEGIIKSSFNIEKYGIVVETACHPEIDQIAVRIESELLQKGKVGIEFDFPYGLLSRGKKSADWNSPHKHTSEIIFQNDRSVVLERKLDSDKYFVSIQWKGTAQFIRKAKHSFILAISEENRFEFICQFSKEKNTKQLPDASETLNASSLHWQKFWQTGGAVDLSESKDHRAHELERRIVLSRYLTAIQCSGSLPPQETDLTFNSWYGKFHLEMHWWHAVQFVLWGNPGLLEKSLAWYEGVYYQWHEKRLSGRDMMVSGGLK